MDLSIIIINWNTRALLRACVESVVAGRGRLDVDVIVVDNASADGSADMVAADFPEVRLMRNARNLGFAAANNQALADARGRHVLLLNSDTEVRGDVLERLVRYADAHEDVGVLGPRVVNPDGSLQRTCFRFPTPGRLLAAALGLHRLPGIGRLVDERMRHWRRDDERDVEVVTGCCLLARRTAIESVGVLDEQFFFYGEESDWCRRMRRAGWSVRFAPVGEVMHHGGASAAALDVGRDLLLAEALIRLQRKHGGAMRAGATWVILALRHAGRAAAWMIASMTGLGRRGRAEASRHVRVLRRFGEAWPRRSGAGPALRGRSMVEESSRRSSVSSASG